ncbi:TPA: IS607 family transposase [Escherichia coli]|nr:IS607 family transposase [Escherichia coli]
MITAGGHRRYKKKNISGIKRQVVAYARVSSHDQKADSEKQKDVLSAHNPDMLLSDIGSGINFNKPRFKKLIQLLLTGQIQKIIITYPDRLLRFGFSLIEKLCQHFGTEITLLNLKKEQSFEETLAQDLITIITVFSSKLYGKRSHQNKKICV